MNRIATSYRLEIRVSDSCRARYCLFQNVQTDSGAYTASIFPGVKAAGA
jgi:hypothetical protein